MVEEALDIFHRAPFCKVKGAGRCSVKISFVRDKADVKDSSLVTCSTPRLTKTTDMFARKQQCFRLI